MNNETDTNSTTPILTTTSILSVDNALIFGIFDRYTVILISAFLLGLLVIGLAIFITICLCKNSMCKLRKSKQNDLDKDVVNSPDIELKAINSGNFNSTKVDKIEYIDDNTNNAQNEEELNLLHDDVPSIPVVYVSSSSSSSSSTINDADSKSNNDNGIKLRDESKYSINDETSKQDRYSKYGAVQSKILNKSKSIEADQNKQKRISQASIHSKDFKDIENVIGNLASNINNEESSSLLNINDNNDASSIANSISDIYRVTLNKKRESVQNKLSKKTKSSTSIVSGKTQSEKSCY